MAFTKTTLDQLGVFLTDSGGALAKGENDVVTAIKDVSGGGDITQADLIKLQWQISRYSITASVFGNIMKEFSDSLKQGANRIS